MAMHTDTDTGIVMVVEVEVEAEVDKASAVSLHSTKSSIIVTIGMMS
jgi:hypothetical protein